MALGRPMTDGDKCVTTRRGHLLQGIRERYPLCCVLRFVFSRRPGTQALDRGAVIDVHKGAVRIFIPCLVLHRSTPSDNWLAQAWGVNQRRRS